MVKRIVGYNDNNEVVFDREARDYDRSIAKEVFGITLGDLVKAGSVVALGVMLYVNQLHFNENVLKSINNVSDSTKQNSEAINGIKEVLYNLNNYLSATTGKQFKKGEPL